MCFMNLLNEEELIFFAVVTVPCKVLRSETLKFPYETVVHGVRIISLLLLFNTVRTGGAHHLQLTSKSRTDISVLCWSCSYTFEIQEKASVVCTPGTYQRLVLDKDGGLPTSAGSS